MKGRVSDTDSDRSKLCRGLYTATKEEKLVGISHRHFPGFLLRDQNSQWWPYNANNKRFSLHFNKLLTLQEPIIMFDFSKRCRKNSRAIIAKTSQWYTRGGGCNYCDPPNLAFKNAIISSVILSNIRSCMLGPGARYVACISAND